MIILGASLPTFGGSESMTKPAGTTPPPDEGCTDVLIETLALVGGIEPVVRIGGQPSSCRPPTNRGCKGPFKEPPLTAELGGPARAALLVMRERIAEPEVRIHSPPAESLQTFGSSRAATAVPGRLTAVAVSVHVGRRTIVLQTSIYRADGKLAAMMIQLTPFDILLPGKLLLELRWDHSVAYLNSGSILSPSFVPPGRITLLSANFNHGPASR
jgi:hypothetical protein